MRTITVPLSIVNNAALDSAIRSTIPNAITNGGVRFNGQTEIDVEDSASDNDILIINNLSLAHDPIFISCDKIVIKSDNIDRCMVTVYAPKIGAAPVTLQLTINDGLPIDFPITLVNGTGSDYFTCKDQGIVKITAKNGTNRNVDVFMVEVVT